jgi:small-conductance mechanosensitive channel
VLFRSDRPPPEAWVEEFGESGIDMAIRFWHAPDIATMWRVRSEVAVAAKQALDKAGIEMPFPQRVVRFVDDHRDDERIGASDGARDRTASEEEADKKGG